MDYTKEILKKYPNISVSPDGKTVVVENAQPNETTEEKSEEKTEKKEVNNNDLELAKLFYDFVKFPPLRGTFLGEGNVVKFSTYDIKTWKIKTKDGYEWYIPQWQTFTTEQNNFKGFQNEKPNDGHEYLITYKGIKKLENNGTMHVCEVLKKIPYERKS